MDNSERPINPTIYADLNDNGGEIYCDQNGLTKFEYFAGLAMQSFILKENINYNIATERAVRCAKALLKEIDNMEQVKIDVIKINSIELKELIKAKLQLESLQGGGVDNWDGYDDSVVDCDKLEDLAQLEMNRLEKQL